MSETNNTPGTTPNIEADAIAEGCDHSKSRSAIETGWYEKPVKAFKRLWANVYGQESFSERLIFIKFLLTSV